MKIRRGFGWTVLFASFAIHPASADDAANAIDYSRLFECRDALQFVLTNTPWQQGREKTTKGHSSLYPAFARQVDEKNYAVFTQNGATFFSFENYYEGEWRNRNQEVLISDFLAGDQQAVGFPIDTRYDSNGAAIPVRMTETRSSVTANTTQRVLKPLASQFRKKDDTAVQALIDDIKAAAGHMGKSAREYRDRIKEETMDGLNQRHFARRASVAEHELAIGRCETALGDKPRFTELKRVLRTELEAFYKSQPGPLGESRAMSEGAQARARKRRMEAATQEAAKQAQSAKPSGAAGATNKTEK